jgi:transposase-like protein
LLTKRAIPTTANLQNPIFTDETKAREWLEARVWPNGPVCPHCGNVDQDKIKSLQGKAHRPGLYQCAECRDQFTVTVKTVFERSKVPLSKWLAALFLLTASKKGVSAHQIHRSLDISYKTAWFMMHRLREAMRQGGLGPLGGEGQIVEADETYFGNVPEAKRRTVTTAGRPFTKKGKTANKRAIVSLVERGGRVRSFHPGTADGETVAEIVRDNIARETRLHTDESRLYVKVGAEFAAHETVNHSAKEYARGDVTTNSVEGYFSIFKRGMRGVYQHCGEKHLHRYLAEYDFRFNHRAALGYDDVMRAEALAAEIKGKRLTYRRSHKA